MKNGTPWWINYHDVTSAAGSNFPTTLPLSPVHQRPNSSATFGKVIDTDVFTILGWVGGANIPVDYNWCMPYDYINYYISKVYDAFVAVRPVNNAFPLFSNGSYQNPYDLSSTDYICHQEYTNNITQDGNIYHTIQYHYTLLQYKGTININYY